MDLEVVKMTLEKEILEELMEKEVYPHIAFNGLESSIRQILEKAIKLTQSKIIQIIDKRIEELITKRNDLIRMRGLEAIPRRANYTKIIKQIDFAIEELKYLLESGKGDANNTFSNIGTPNYAGKNAESSLPENSKRENFIEVVIGKEKESMSSIGLDFREIKEEG